MVARNEEQLIGLSLDSVKQLADEVIVVDTGSTDRTTKIAAALGAQVIPYRWDGSLGRARNTYLKAARGNWILVLDGDEAIARKDLSKIEALMRRRSAIGYSLAIRNYTDGHDLMWNWYPNDRGYPREEKFSGCPGWAKTQPLRLFRNFPDLAYVEGSSVHTTPLASLKKNQGRIENRDDVVIHHFQHLKGGARFLSSKQQTRLKGEMRHARQFPHESWTYLNIAKTLFALKRDREALKNLARAVKLDADFHDAYQLWGMIEFQNGNLFSAEARLREAIRVAPSSADAWAILGMVLIEAGNYDEGMLALKKAIALRPNHLLAHNSLGVLCEELAMYSQARQEYRRALRLHPGFAPAKANLARLNGARNRSSAARVRKAG
jgi:glycosyltransferase involved in cell wall biosynthesis